MKADGSPLRAVVLAYHDVGCAGLEELLAQGDEVLGVFTHEDDPGENVGFGSVAGLASARGLPVFTPQDVNRPEWVEAIRALQPTILFSFYYRRMIAEEILRIPPLGALNLHGSLLPRYRGRAPVNWVLVNGEVETGVTLHYMTAKPDAGDIVAQRRVAIEFEDTAPVLLRKIVVAARETLRDTLPLLRLGRAARVPQDLSRGTYCRGRRPEDGRIDWSRSAVEIHNLVRAVTRPYPGAFTFLGGRKLYVWAGRSLPSAGARVEPGRVIGVEHERDAALVGTGDGTYRVDVCQLEGERDRHGAFLPVGTLLGAPSP
jgi:UDP-4-amino-4-deoxy-L-arabinose formyltransferase/UDP-glucuronic acid dehydrogenase (UDP-4-keto-hexauronic acid decarboxylating)